MKNISLICLFLIFTLGALLRVELSEVKNRTPDEHRYQGFALMVLQEGSLSAVSILSDIFINNPKLWLYPSPTRVGVYGPHALVLWLMGDSAPTNLAYLSTFASLGTLLLVAAIGYLIGGFPTSIISSLLYSCSPLSLALARRGWVDGVQEFFAAILLLCGLLIVKQSSIKLLPYILFFICACYSFVIKETSMLLVGLITLTTSTLIFIQGRRLRAIYVALLGAVSIICGTLLLAFLVGGFHRLQTLATHTKAAMPFNTYANVYQNGPWHDFISAYFYLTPTFCVLIAGIVIVFIHLPIIRSRRWIAERKFQLQVIFSYAITILLIVTAFCIPPYLKNLRYIASINPILYIVTGYLIAQLLSKSANMTKRIAVNFTIAILLITTVFLDISHYKRIIFKTDCADLPLKMIKACKASALRSDLIKMSNKS